LRLFRRRSQSRAKHTREISASAEHTATAAFPCPVKELPDVVDAPAAVALAATVGVAGVSCEEATTAGESPGRVVIVVVVGGLVLTDIASGMTLDWGECVASGICKRVAEQSPAAFASVLHLKPGGGGPGSRMELNPILVARLVSERRVSLVIKKTHF
jgi:hypothetical protein